MGNALKYKNAINAIDANNQNQTYASNFNIYGDITNKAIFTVRPFDDEVPPNTYDGALDLDEDDDDMLDRNDYKYIQKYSTVSGAITESLKSEAVMNLMNPHKEITRGDYAAAGIYSASALGLAATFEYQEHLGKIDLKSHKKEYEQAILQELIKIPKMYIELVGSFLKELDGVKDAKNVKQQEL